MRIAFVPPTFVFAVDIKLLVACMVCGMLSRLAVLCYTGKPSFF